MAGSTTSVLRLYLLDRTTGAMSVVAELDSTMAALAPVDDGGRVVFIGRGQSRLGGVESTTPQLMLFRDGAPSRIDGGAVVAAPARRERLVDG